MAMNLATVAFLLASTTLFSASSSSEATTLAIHNLCPYPVWPLVFPNTGFPALFDSAVRLDANANVSVPFPDAIWAGGVAARTGCAGAGARRSCATGAAPPSTVALLTVHEGGSADEAVYGVSLVDGFNVPMAIIPQGQGGTGQCRAMGCAADLNRECPPDQRAAGGAACRGPPEYFKARCPLTRTSLGDKEPLPEGCGAPGEIKIVLCQPSVVAGTAVEADS